MGNTNINIVGNTDRKRNETEFNEIVRNAITNKHQVTINADDMERAIKDAGLAESHVTNPNNAVVAAEVLADLFSVVAMTMLYCLRYVGDLLAPEKDRLQC